MKNLLSKICRFILITFFNKSIHLRIGNEWCQSDRHHIAKSQTNGFNEKNINMNLLFFNKKFKKDSNSTGTNGLPLSESDKSIKRVFLSQT